MDQTNWGKIEEMIDMYRARGKFSINLAAPWDPRDDPLKPPLQCWVLLFFTLVLFLGIFSYWVANCYCSSRFIGPNLQSTWRFFDLEYSEDLTHGDDSMCKCGINQTGWDHDWWWGMGRLLKNVQIGREGNWYGMDQSYFREGYWALPP